MTLKSDFTEEEWARVRRGPFVAGMAISIADPGGPIELLKETMASLRSATEPPVNEELVTSLARDVKEMAQRRESPIEKFKPTNAALAGQEVLKELRAVNQIVTTKATPEEAAAYRAWLKATAQAAAAAAKEGGFMGFGAEQVSKGEQSMLDQIEAALS